ncbi:related to lactonohydrolase [Rhynchosporium graminicola]|uniref:Related to lactonohydrolase n=1 Tax=Rhynchosporium graminicola TaxID=2792576 RepID=A0A1E1L8G2_9HELO|nr:related to lactonohydrolase [Rhynchosporium commune]
MKNVLIAPCWPSPEFKAFYKTLRRITPEALADITTFNNASTSSEIHFQVYDDAFLAILGQNPSFSLILSSANSSFPQFHEAAILASTTPPVLFVSSNQFKFTGIDSPDTNQKAVVISRITQDSISQNWTSEIITPTGSEIHLANGGTVSPDGSLIFCAQGDIANPGGLLRLNPTAPFETTNLINNYMGVPFNSLNDVVRTSDGALWFTDPQFGFLQKIRPAPQLPAQVYRWFPGTTDIRVVADGFAAPNGIAFSPDEKTAYITDTAQSPEAPTASKTIYAYDVTSGPGPLLANRRTFAMPSVGIPDGIKTDKAGNVYAGCGDGVNVCKSHNSKGSNPALFTARALIFDAPAKTSFKASEANILDKGNLQGKLLGKILVPGGAANFALGENGMVFMLNENKLFLATLAGNATNTGA